MVSWTFEVKAVTIYESVAGGRDYVILNEAVF